MVGWGVLPVYKQRIFVVGMSLLERRDDHFYEPLSSALPPQEGVYDQAREVAPASPFITLSERGELPVGITERVGLHDVNATVLDKGLSRKRKPERRPTPAINGRSIGKPGHDLVEIGIRRSRQCPAITSQRQHVQ